MTKDQIIVLPNPHLRQKSVRVGVITNDVLKIIDDMKSSTIDWDESRAHEIGVALAAVQIDQLFKIIIVRKNYEAKEDKTFNVYVNPEIVKTEGEIKADYEGCLSVPNIYGKVPRHTKVKIKALNEKGQQIRVTAEGFLARIFQHEIDHCNGLVFVDHIKDQADAFFKLSEGGKLTELDYEKDVANNSLLWQ